jgi:Tat protein translocase TatB subunit
MFGMSMTEIIIIAVIALILLGPKDLPNAARTLGKAYRDVKKAGDDLRDTFEREVMQEPTKPTKPPPGAISAGDLEQDPETANTAPTEGPAALPAPAAEPTVDPAKTKESA